ncbi:hypothetical protein T261_06971 [Streptomyces lydicus]|nr:hypothetical protein T261_06971 [Streptomyces lydicus]
MIRKRPALHANEKDRAANCGPVLDPGGRYWVRTSDLFGVNEALSH